jgi:hypothetical protein
VDEAENITLEKNLAKMKETSEDKLCEIKRQRNVLTEDLDLLKDCQKHEKEMSKPRRDKWDKEREKLKE